MKHFETVIHKPCHKDPEVQLVIVKAVFECHENIYIFLGCLHRVSALLLPPIVPATSCLILKVRVTNRTSLLISGILSVVEPKFDALVAAHLCEVIFDGFKAAPVSSLPDQVLQSLCLSCPSLLRSNIRQEGTAEGLL